MPDKQPYRQFIYHFHYPRNSIDARNITDEEMDWCLECLAQYNVLKQLNVTKRSNFDRNCETIQKMFKEWFPERLI